MKTDTKLIPSALLASALLLGVATPGPAQQVASPPASQEDEKNKKDDTVNLEAFVTTGTRTAKAVNQIPGAIKLISNTEITNTLLLTDDATAVLARTVPGYSPATQQMQNTGETLRGRVALRLFDGISQTTPLREGNRNATFTDMDVVAQIEVINGPSASEGIGAAGGIINYISKSPTVDGSESTVRAKYWTQGKDDSDGYRLGLNYTFKEGPTDLIFAASVVSRGVPYDANGRRIGLGASGSTSDSDAQNFFLKAGRNFGKNNSQRIMATFSQFRIEGNGRYVEVPGSRALGITDSSRPGVTPGARGVFNDFKQYALAYRNDALFGGTLNIQVYKASQAMRFVPEVVAADKADPLVAPLGVGIDQSEINSQKKGARNSWVRKDLFGVAGLEVNTGFDYLEETAQQRLALTNRTWVPPMNYTSKAPFAQFSYERGPVTVSAGVRHEDGELQVDDYTTVFFANRSFVRGGTLDYSETLPNVGLIVRLPQNWSVFGSYSKGFTLPNVGIPLRNVSIPNQTVAGIVDLQAVVVDNKEVGFSWRGKQASFSTSYYRSYSELGASLTTALLGTPPNQTIDFVLQRRPVKIEGYEFQGEYRLSDTLKFTGLYSHVEGLTRTTETGPLTREMGMSNISPDKLNLSTTWKYHPKGSLTLDVEHVFSRDINVGRAGEEHTTSLTLAHLTTTYSTPWGDFSLGIENLTDKFYILPWAQIDQFNNYFSGRGRIFTFSWARKF
jgi:iron complex outermembrane receptor protein